MAVAMVAPRARPVMRASPRNCSAVATAPTALTPPATAARITAPRRARALDPLAISANIVIGRTALAAQSASSTGRRPLLSDHQPISGVTRITATAAMVESHSALRSVSALAEVRNDGT